MAPYPACAGAAVAAESSSAAPKTNIKLIRCIESPAIYPAHRAGRLTAERKGLFIPDCRLEAGCGMSVVAFGAVHLALPFRMLLAVLHRVEFGGGAARLLPGAPGLAALAGSDRAALPHRGAEHDLALVAAAFLHRHVIGLGLRLFVRAQPVLAAALLIGERAKARECRTGRGNRRYRDDKDP